MVHDEDPRRKPPVRIPLDADPLKPIKPPSDQIADLIADCARKHSRWNHYDIADHLSQHKVTAAHVLYVFDKTPLPNPRA